MKVFVITEGVSEYRSLPKIAGQVYASCGAVLRMLQTSVAGDVPVAAIIKRSIANVKIALADKADLVILLLDREGQDNCCGEVAEAIRSHLCREVGSIHYEKVRVVLKNRKFENWLIADLDALRSQPRRFKVTPAIARKIVPNKADDVDAESVIKSLALGPDYDKVPDSGRICERMDVERAAANSRSLRHFLHVLGHPSYKEQCRQPVAVVPKQRKPNSSPAKRASR